MGIPQFAGFDGALLSSEVAQHTPRLPPQEGRLGAAVDTASGNRKEWMEEDGSVSLQARMPIVDRRRPVNKNRRCDRIRDSDAKSHSSRIEAVAERIGEPAN